VLNQWDSIYFNPQYPHGQRCHGDAPCKFITIIAEWFVPPFWRTAESLGAAKASGTPSYPFRKARRATVVRSAFRVGQSGAPGAFSFAWF